ncbi:hypothetical protein K458DRAFT_342065 [Lentithecium fluviatile CBS 122367]|uniref:F-box domain-containing protein n=1 Tax=Lentithecium fluviatile CBS 122367 TaxID=1168545 RepID=A0A6G1IWF9_9PLEO|nr:hypothetical protein K458DRAFT_342065 [Lentithecium fluviatile CBS 122367]
MAAKTAVFAFPFLQLPRELRDLVYHYTFSLPDPRADHDLRIERRHLKHFAPSACSILLLLHHECLLLNHQVVREALEVLFKHHTILFSCGPYVLKELLMRVEDKGYPCKQWLKWIKSVEFDWVTFPNLKLYPPEKLAKKDEWWWERDGQEVDVGYVTGGTYNGHYDEHDHEGSHYNDNIYGAEDVSLYPSRHQPGASASNPSSNDVFGFSSHYPFGDPLSEPSYDVEATEHMDSKLDLLISSEVAPLFDYLATPVFSLTSITLPLYFVTKQPHIPSREYPWGYSLPLKIRYWTQVCIHALLMLHRSSPVSVSSSSGSSSAMPTLQEVRIKYMPWDIWASMDPNDNLYRMAEKGVWFNGGEDEINEREGEGEAFRAVWAGLQEKGLCVGEDRMSLEAEINFVKWDGDLDGRRVGDELEVVFRMGWPRNVAME